MVTMVRVNPLIKAGYGSHLINLQTYYVSKRHSEKMGLFNRQHDYVAKKSFLKLYTLIDIRY